MDPRLIMFRKSLLIYTSLLLLHILIGCNSKGTHINTPEKSIMLDKITESEILYSIEGFEKIDSKVSKSYKVKNFPSANEDSTALGFPQKKILHQNIYSL